jgi:hypothetical protein
VFVGTPCPHPRHEDDGEFVDCGADPVAVAYSPAHDAWRTLLRLRLAQPTHGVSLLSSAIGFASGQAVFSYDPGTATNDLLLVDSETGVAHVRHRARCSRRT